MDIELQIAEIGNKLVSCRLKCSGINCDPNNGIPPRCLYYETKNRSAGLGVVIVGINPGSAQKEEKDYLKENGISYKQVVKYWDENIGKKHPYYYKLRDLADQLKLDGPILWTELVKCQKDDFNEYPFTIRNYTETFRSCTREYLEREIDTIPKEWPLIAVGGETYKALALKYAERKIIGVPHPTASYGHFPKLLENNKLNKRCKNKARNVLDGKADKAIWLFDKCRAKSVQ